MRCTACGAPVSAPPPGAAPIPCPACGAPVRPIDPRLAAYLVDENQNGVPDILERPGAPGAFGAPPPAFGAPAGGPGLYRAPGPSAELAAVPPAPRAPSPRARSLVYGYKGSQGVRLTIGLIFLAVGSLSTIAFGWGIPLDLALEIAGSRARGTVTGSELISNVKVNGVRPQRLRFRFRVGASTYEGDSATLDSALRRTPVGAEVPVEYLGAAPSISRVEGSTISSMGYAGVFTLIFPAVGLGLALSAWRSNRREIRAFSRGTPVIARVTRRGFDTTTKVNGRHPFLIAWEFSVGGRPYTGTFTIMDREELGGLDRADEIVVLHDPGDPAVNTIWIA